MQWSIALRADELPNGVQILDEAIVRMILAPALTERHSHNCVELSWVSYLHCGNNFPADFVKPFHVDCFEKD